MAKTALLKKLPYMKECMAQADPTKEACAVKKMSAVLFYLFIFYLFNVGNKIIQLKV